MSFIPYYIVTYQTQFDGRIETRSDLEVHPVNPRVLVCRRPGELTLHYQDPSMRNYQSWPPSDPLQCAGFYFASKQDAKNFVAVQLKEEAVRIARRATDIKRLLRIMK